MGIFAGTPFDRPPHCPVCDRLETECVCPPPEASRIAPEKQTARVKTEKRKKGKLMTVISGLPAEGNDLSGLLTDLKNHLGAGGTLEGEELLIQGDQVKRVEDWLKTRGYKVKAGR